MSFPAAYPGTCGACSGHIKVGQEITRLADKSYAHAVTEDCVAEEPLRVTNPLCDTCFLYHPPGTCDR